MRIRIPSGRCCALFAAVCALALVPLRGQQSNGGQNKNAAAHASGGKNTGAPQGVKQEFGPQTAARRGDRMTVVTPPGKGRKPQGTSASPNMIDSGGKPQRLQNTKSSNNPSGKPVSTNPK